MTWLPLVFAGAYVGALTVTFGSLVRALYSSADVASAPYIGELFPSAPSGSHVVLGHVAWYEALWAEWLTRSWPVHRHLWEIGPWTASLIGIALLAWATAKAAGRFAATIVAVTLACAGAGLISYQFPAAIHALTWVHVCVLGAFLVLVAERGRVHPGLWAVLALVTAVGVASDKLLVVAGVTPFVLAAGVVGRRVLVSAAALAGASIAGAVATVALMHSAHVRADSFPIHFAGWQRLGSNVRVLGDALLYLFNGEAGSPRADARWALGFACTLVLVAAVVFAGWSLVDRLPGRPATRAHVAFWGLAGGLLAAAFVFSNVPIDRFSARYVVALAYAIAVLAAVAGARGGLLARALVTVGACLIVSGSITAIAARDLEHASSAYPPPALASKLLEFARAAGLHDGYAGYWDAAPLTWQTGTRLRIYPVWPCPTEFAICPFPFNRIASWYTPRSATRTFLVVDAARPAHLARYLPQLGPAERSTRIGRLTILVYGYDIASRFGVGRTP